MQTKSSTASLWLTCDFLSVCSPLFGTRRAIHAFSPTLQLSKLENDDIVTIQ
ncbi:hypothetical protein BofuT4_uP092890.1 [Botrytis cinerea T4]|uniref:Uncharacterized protein n=1 Tax=Botryotinia fuckeliana (strain T4) TaxID=999810 RepID=G2YE19_BOTF4|nr:hypothetical protein BofuT4_uP092890.1 [Botrytis cinerea T4]